MINCTETLRKVSLYLRNYTELLQYVRDKMLVFCFCCLFKGEKFPVHRVAL